MQTLIDDQTTTFFYEGEQLPREADYLWIIVQGVVKTYTYKDNGASITLGFWGKEDIIGPSLSKLTSYRFKCLSDVRAISIPCSQKETIVKQLFACSQQTQQLMYIVRNTRIAQRLWLLLMWLGNKFGRTVEQGNMIDFKLTHQELADALGTTRITVTKILSQFEREGLILRPKTKCIIITK